MRLSDKNIVICVSGGIAAYKSVELLRLLTKSGADVKVMMTKSAEKFVDPLTFKTLSGNPVCTDLFEKESDASIKHIDWAEEADLVVIAPATANIIGKIANGIADDAVSTFILAVKSPVIICPSMNTHMYESLAVQRNLDILEKDGFIILEPGSGELACGIAGPGRLPEPALIFDRILSVLTPKDLKGKKVLVTAGPTREYIDPVRFISNPSSGKMGFAIARTAENRGAKVVLITGPTDLADPINVATIRVETAKEMAEAVFEHFDNTDIMVKSAAVSDYSPADTAKHKIKKTEDQTNLTLIKTKDILKELGARKKNQILVGFAAETTGLEKYSKQKLAEKNLDIIVANIVGTAYSGFQSDTNKVTLFYKNGTKESLATMEKDRIAYILFDRIIKLNPTLS